MKTVSPSMYLSALAIGAVNARRAFPRFQNAGDPTQASKRSKVARVSRDCFFLVISNSGVLNIPQIARCENTMR